MSNPWFRLYTEIVDDEKLRLLAFEDRWHFVAILCCKGKGILDEHDIGLMRRKVAVKLGLDTRALDEVARRLAEVELIDEQTLQPLAWDRRQYVSDHDPTRADRAKKFRQNKKLHNVTDEERKRNGSVTDEERKRNASVTDVKQAKSTKVTDTKRTSNASRNGPVTAPSRPPDTDPEADTDQAASETLSQKRGSFLAPEATEQPSNPPPYQAAAAAVATPAPAPVAPVDAVADDDPEQQPESNANKKDAPIFLNNSNFTEQQIKRQQEIRRQLEQMGIAAERLEPTPNKLRAIA